MSKQDKANEKAYADGARVRSKGLGKKAHALRRLFERGLGFVGSVDREECFEWFLHGYNDESDRLAAWANGEHPCGLPFRGGGLTF